MLYAPLLLVYRVVSIGGEVQLLNLGYVPNSPSLNPTCEELSLCACGALKLRLLLR